MFPRGTIYQYGYPEKGEKRLHPTFWTRLGYDAARGIGAGLVGFAFISFLFSYTPVIKEELSFRLRSHKAGQSDFGVLLEKAQAQNQEEVRAEAASLGINSYFSLYIPKLDAKSEIIPNVSAADKESYLSALEDGVAHAAGTHFPGQGERIYLFSHSTDSPLNFARYNAVFYLLRKLEPGDRIIVFFADQKYEYEVVGKEVVGADDTSWLTQKSADEELVLQTCDPPGTTWRRLLILAKPVGK